MIKTILLVCVMALCAGFVLEAVLRLAPGPDADSESRAIALASQETSAANEAVRRFRVGGGNWNPKSSDDALDRITHLRVQHYGRLGMATDATDYSVDGGIDRSLVGYDTDTYSFYALKRAE